MSDNNSNYEPIYFSHKYAWINDKNMTIEEVEKRMNNLRIAQEYLQQFLQLCEDKNISLLDIRQVMVSTTFSQKFYDNELTDFDKKVERDVAQIIVQDLNKNSQ